MLKVGSKAPEFSLLETNGKVISSKDLLGKKYVLYFYPKDLTGGCTDQAIGYKELYNQFKDLGILVIGISKDSIKQHAKFIEVNNLPFLLLSDESINTIKEYDCWGEKSLYGKKYMGTIRTTYIIDEQGFIVYADDKVKVKTDAVCVLNSVILNK